MDLETLAAELAGPCEELGRMLLHNAALASGELFHSNVLAFLIEVTRPESGTHELLESLLRQCGCEGWPVSAECLGTARPTKEQLGKAVKDRLGISNLGSEQVEGLESLWHDMTDGTSYESVNRLTQREAKNFDLIINLHEHGSGRVVARAKKGTGKEARPGRRLNSFTYKLDDHREFRLVIENKVKSIATQRQLDDYRQALEELKGESRLVLLTLFPFDGPKQAGGRVPLLVMQYRELADWLRSVLNLTSVSRNAPWLGDYIDYVDALVTVAGQVWNCILEAERADRPIQDLDALVKRPLARCRMFASYQKLRASRMASLLESRLKTLSPPLKSIRKGDPWPSEPHLDVSFGYSNQSGSVNAVLFKPRNAGDREILEAVGFQYQNGEYRPHVWWGWRSEKSKEKKRPQAVAVPTTDEDTGSGERVSERAIELSLALTGRHAEKPDRNFTHRWKGFARAIRDTPRSLLDRMEGDVRRLVSELS